MKLRRQNRSGKRWTRTLAFGIGVLALCGVSVTVNAQGKTPRYPVQQFTLKNGMKVILSEDHSAPVIGLALAYDVGSRNEQKGRTGFAHLFEHMMFQGSANVGKFEHPRYIESNGGIMNGFTRNEDTTYIETVPSEKLPLVLWLEADRMRSLNVSAENLKNQQEVVKEEKRLRFDNQPYVKARQETIPSLAYSNFANQHTTIGSMEDLDAAGLQDVQSFFRTYYAPNNATLVLVGDLNPGQAKALVSKYFGDIPRQYAPPKTDLTEPKQTGEKRDAITDPLARIPALAIAFHGPSLDDKDRYAVELMSEILFSGETSRAYQELVKKQQLVLQVSGGLDAQRGPSLFEIFALYPGNKSAADVEKAIYAQIDALKAAPPTEAELERVKTRLKSSRYNGMFGLESMLGRAIQIADYAVFQGNPKLINTEIERYENVTPGQIQAVARKYFMPENRTVVEIKAGAGMPRPNAPANGSEQGGAK